MSPSNRRTNGTFSHSGWAIIVGMIIAGWKATTQLSKENEEMESRLEKLGNGCGGNIDDNNSINNN